MPRSVRAPLPLKQGFQSQLPQEDHDFLVKIVLAGDCGVGCSSLLLKYTENTYTESYISTIGIDSKTTTCRVDSHIVKHMIWDAPRRYGGIHQPDYRGAHAIILAFDLSDAESFMNLDGHLRDIDRSVGDSIPIVLVGTKSDLPVSRRQVSAQQILEYMTRYRERFFGYVQTSAKTGAHVDQAFELATRSYIQHSVPSHRDRNSAADLKDPAKESVILALEKYLARIDIHKTLHGDTPDFRHGFWFFANSRAANRKANYLLAQSLLKDLYQRLDCSIEEIFNQVDGHREDIIETDRVSDMQDYVHRGMNSKELQRIFDQVKNYVSVSVTGSSSATYTCLGQ